MDTKVLLAIGQIRNTRTYLSSESFWTFLLTFGFQIGCALGFLIPPEIVINTDDLDVIGQRLSVMFYGGAALTTAIFVLILVCEFF